LHAHHADGGVGGGVGDAGDVNVEGANGEIGITGGWGDESLEDVGRAIVCSGVRSVWRGAGEGGVCGTGLNLRSSFELWRSQHLTVGLSLCDMVRRAIAFFEDMLLPVPAILELWRASRVALRFRCLVYNPVEEAIIESGYMC
jgi:hypothetical protein